MFEKLEILFDGMHGTPPIAFVFMGNFMEELIGLETMVTLKNLFKQLAELIGRYSNLIDNSEFIFVPGMLDPCSPHIVPRSTYIF